MIVTITTEAKNEEQLDANLQAVREAVTMGSIFEAELMDGSFQIEDHTNIELEMG